MAELFRSFNAIALIAALGAGELSCGGGMGSPKCLPHSGFKYLVALGADI